MKLGIIVTDAETGKVLEQHTLENDYVIIAAGIVGQVSRPITHNGIDVVVIDKGSLE